MPTSIDKINKILLLEAENGFENRAIIGGLEKMLPWWENEARASNVADEVIAQVHQKLIEYPSIPQENRRAFLQEMADSCNFGLKIPDGKKQRHEEKPAPVQDSNPAPFRHQTAPRQQPPQERPQQKESRSYQPRQESQPPQQRPPRENSKHPGISASSPGLTAPLTVISGIGPKTAQSLRALGLKTLEDLLYYFPRRYDDYSQMKPINRLVAGEEVTIMAMVKSMVTRTYGGGQKQFTEAVVSDGTGFIRLIWFNPWAVYKLTEGIQIVISGKVELNLGRLVMKNPEWDAIDQEHLHTNRIVPVYSLTARITQKWLRRVMFETVTHWAPRIRDFMPASIKDSANLPDLSVALEQAHFPESSQALASARARLSFDEIFLVQLGVLRQKRNWQAVGAKKFSVPDMWLNQQLKSLPFTLTNSQMQVLEDIRRDLQSGHPMNRLLQGDVGSGKTVIAALGMAIVISSGAQAAIMAPTSILAEQHYRNMVRLLANEENSNRPCQPDEIRLLVGDTPEAEKEAIRQGLQDGSIKMIVGTHALIEGPVQFKNLQMAVIDEQHRFGVEQRSLLRTKGENPHLLVMTATPIPRSLALTVYGDLDLSVIGEMPVGRQPVDTHVLLPLERERAYSLIQSEVAKGRQAFIIYPLVEQGNKEETKAAVEEQERLQTEIFPRLKVGLMHGRLKADEKERVMTDFRNGEYHILVSTSVVEVGVDVPNATVMIIEGANRFGLAQLHQFRGRVGRGSEKSFCLLIPESENDVENQRLAVMAETNDGFVLAEKDLEQRGPGDFLGTRQAGFADLRMANLMDVRLIEKARNQAQTLFEKDPDLMRPEMSDLKVMLEHFWTAGRGDVS